MKPQALAYIEATHRFRARNRERLRDAARLRRYGLTPEAYRAMIASQEGRCAACGGHPKRLVIDHDHATGAVRGLLCNGCNVALGLLGDDPARISRLAAYLGEHEAERLHMRCSQDKVAV